MMTKRLAASVLSLALFFGAAGCGDDESDDQDVEGGGDADSDGDSDGDSDADGPHPCGEISEGDINISGDARIDGLFDAVVQIIASTSAIKTEFEEDARDLATELDMNVEGMDVHSLVAELKAVIMANIYSSVDGELVVLYGPPKCFSDTGTAVKAQFACEAQAGCQPPPNPDAVTAVLCEGFCEGSCSGGCEGEMLCELELGTGGECPATCEGLCENEGSSMACEGLCTGTCDDEAVDNGACHGGCSGTCEFLPQSGQCEGTCKGECSASVISEADCEGDVTCRGSCMGELEGDCLGAVTPATDSADCEASADCNAVAEALGFAKLSCSAPFLRVGFTPVESLDAIEREEFADEMALLTARMKEITQGAAQLRMLVDGDNDRGLESPLIMLTHHLEGLRSMGAESFGIDSNRVVCVNAALEDAVVMLMEAATDSAYTRKSQEELIAILM